MQFTFNWNSGTLIVIADLLLHFKLTLMLMHAIVCTIEWRYKFIRLLNFTLANLLFSLLCFFQEFHIDKLFAADESIAVILRLNR